MFVDWHQLSDKEGWYFCVFKNKSIFLVQRAGTSSLPAMNAEFGREETKHDRLPKKQNLKTLEILPQMQTQALWYNRQLQWTSLHKMLAVPWVVADRPFRTTEINGNFNVISGALHPEYGLLAPSNGPSLASDVWNVAPNSRAAAGWEFLFLRKAPLAVVRLFL